MHVGFPVRDNDDLIPSQFGAEESSQCIRCPGDRCVVSEAALGVEGSEKSPEVAGEGLQFGILWLGDRWSGPVVMRPQHGPYPFDPSPAAQVSDEDGDE